MDFRPLIGKQRMEKLVFRPSTFLGFRVSLSGGRSTTAFQLLKIRLIASMVWHQLFPSTYNDVELFFQDKINKCIF